MDKIDMIEKILKTFKPSEIFDTIELLKNIMWMPDSSVNLSFGENDYGDLVAKL